MSQDASGEYFKNAVMTATPEQLQLMLYDGAIRFAGQARDALVRGDFEESCEKLIRAQNIVLEMRNGLRHDVNESLCTQMSALYTFIYNRLVEGNMKRSPGAIDEALKILNHQRETWQLLLDKVRVERGKSTSRSDADSPATSNSTGLSLSISG
ncbi:MAG: flagellar export chaperone FliS [Planctomycetes bacterium]|nr:flagellar export chaperone FliS [Planctomycetota bacterium]